MKEARRRFLKRIGGIGGGALASGIAGGLDFRSAIAATSVVPIDKPVTPGRPLRRPPTVGGAALKVTRDAASDPYARDMQWYTMHRMNDGRLLLAGGGYHSKGVRVNSVRAYDPQTRSWGELQPNDFGATRWDSTDNQAQWFIPSLGTQGALVYSYCGVLDIASNTWLVSDIGADFPSGNYGTNPVTNYIEMYDSLSLAHLKGLNAATEWCQAIDVGIQTQDAEGGNGPGSNNYWSWLEKNPNYPSSSTKPLRLRTFSPPTVLYDANFRSGDTVPHGGWMNCRNISACVGEYLYVGGGFTWNAAMSLKRGNRRFVKIHLPTLYAATSDAEKNASVTFLADCPVENYYGALSYDSARQAFLLVRGTSGVSTEWGGNGVDSPHGCNELYRYDITTNTWSDVTPSLAAQPDWCRYYLAGWMSVYDPVTDAHYVREGAHIDQSDLTKYDQYSNGSSTDSGSYAGRMRKIQFADTPPSRFSTVLHGGGQPFNGSNNVKHVTLHYNSATDELIQCGGDFYTGAMTQPDGSPFLLGSTKRDMWKCNPRADGGVLNWTLVQPEFMPAGQFQGAGGPDQVWWLLRTAVTPNEYWLLPGAYRAGQYERDPGLTPFPMKPAYWGDLYAPMKWLRPGWSPVMTAKEKKYIGYVKNPAMEIGIHTTEPDKFCAYDPKTDSAYCINDNFEIVKFSFAALDWTVNLIGQPATDDDGLAILNHELSIGGSHVARVDRKIYSLCGWEQGSTLATRSYLAWYDIDTQQRGLIRCPFDIDDEYFVANAPDFGGRNPEESAGLVALHRHLVVIRVYNPRPAGYPCMWSYDVDRKQWTSGELPPFTTYSRTWVALPFDNSVMFFGVQGDANEAYFALRTVFKYRVF